MYESGKLVVCKYCQSYNNGQCCLVYRPGTVYPCANFVKKGKYNADRNIIPGNRCSSGH